MFLLDTEAEVLEELILEDVVVVECVEGELRSCVVSVVTSLHGESRLRL